MIKFPSTLLPKTNDPAEIQKGHLDLLKKINQLAGGGVLSLVQEDYREKVDDGYEMIDANCGANQHTVYLSPSQQVPGRARTYGKNDSGAGELRLLCQGNDVIKYPGGTATAVYVGLQNQNTTLIAVSGGFEIVAGVVQPVPTEPSLGTPHEMAFANRSPNYVVNTSTTPAATWSAAVTMTYAPTGANWGYCMMYRAGVTNPDAFVVAKASGITLDTAANFQYQYPGVFLEVGGAAGLSGMVWIPIDANKQFKWCTVGGNGLIHIASPVAYMS